MASGDLSHKLKSDGPYGFAPEGPVFDEAVTKPMASGHFLDFLTMDESLCERAAECGLRSFQIMAGALDGLAVQPQLLSHEGPFGVGYAVALFPVTGRDETRRYAAACEQIHKERLQARRAKEDPFVRLARLSLETYIRKGHPLQALPENLPTELLSQAAGAFVSLHKDGRLRGCIGTTLPTEKNVAWEIVQNAISAGTRDPRFPAVRAGELDELTYSVDVLSPPEPVESPAQLNPKQYGVIVRYGRKRGLLLPDLDGVDTVRTANHHRPAKGRHPEDDPYTLQRFKGVGGTYEGNMPPMFSPLYPIGGPDRRLPGPGKPEWLHWSRSTMANSRPWPLIPSKKSRCGTFTPAAGVLSVGSFGCNLHCPFCQNASIAAAGEETYTQDCTPEQLVQKALELREKGNIGRAYTYNEPLVGYEYVRDCAELIHQAGLYIVLVTTAPSKKDPG